MTDPFLNQVAIAIVCVAATLFILKRILSTNHPKQDDKKEKNTAAPQSAASSTSAPARSKVVPSLNTEHIAAAANNSNDTKGNSRPTTSRPAGIPSLKIPGLAVEAPPTSDSLSSSSSPSSSKSNQDDDTDNLGEVKAVAESMQSSREENASIAAIKNLLAVTPIFIPITPPTTPSSAVIDEADDEPGPSPSFCRRSDLPPLKHPALAKKNPSKPPSSLALGVDLEKIREQFGGMPEDEQDRFQRLQVSDSQASEVAPHLYLSSHKISDSLEELKRLNITHVLNLASSVCKNVFENHPEISITYMALDLTDGPTEDVICHVYDCIDFIDSGLSSGGNVLVHCWQGVSRSTSMVVAWLMLRKGMSYDEALKSVRTVRSVARPNTGFMCQLLDWGLRLTKGPKKNMIYFVSRRQNDKLVARLIRDHDLGSKHELLSYQTTCVILHSTAALYLWEGSECPSDHLAKGLHHTQRLRDHEHAPNIQHIKQGAEPEEFWSCLAGASQQ